MAPRTGIGKRIQTARKAKDMSAADLARVVGVTRMAVSTWESAKALPRPSMLSKIARAVGVSTEYLLSGKRGNRRGQDSEPVLSVAELLEDVRFKISKATGIPPERVRLRVEFIDPQYPDEATLT